MTRKFLIRFFPGEDGYILAECPVLPGCLSQGKTEAEAIANIKEAIAGILTVRHTHGLPLPPQETLVEVDLAA